MDEVLQGTDGRCLFEMERREHGHDQDLIQYCVVNASRDVENAQ